MDTAAAVQRLLRRTVTCLRFTTILGEAVAPASGLTATITVATLNVREGPGVEYAVVGTLFAGDVVNVLFRNEANTWYYICCVPETGGAAGRAHSS